MYHDVRAPRRGELDFLDVFVGAFDRGRWGGAPLPLLHCYCFSSATDPRADAVARAEAALGCALPGAEATEALPLPSLTVGCPHTHTIPPQARQKVRFLTAFSGSRFFYRVQMGTKPAKVGRLGPRCAKVKCGAASTPHTDGRLRKKVFDPRREQSC